MLPKGNKLPVDRSYRAISLLDTAGQISEPIMANKIEAVSKEARGLFHYQYDFRKIGSTIDALWVVVDTARTTTEERR